RRDATIPGNTDDADGSRTSRSAPSVPRGPCPFRGVRGPAVWLAGCDMTLAAHLGKDARLLLRNRALLVALLAYPFLLAIVLGAAFQQPPTKLSLVVVDQDSPDDALQVGNETLTSRDIVVAATSYADVKEVASEPDGLA